MPATALAPSANVAATPRRWADGGAGARDRATCHGYAGTDRRAPKARRPAHARALKVRDFSRVFAIFLCWPPTSRTKVLPRPFSRFILDVIYYATKGAHATLVYMATITPFGRSRSG